VAQDLFHAFVVVNKSAKSEFFSSRQSLLLYFFWEGSQVSTRHPAEALGLDVVLQRVEVKDGAGVCPPHLQVLEGRESS